MLTPFGIYVYNILAMGLSNATDLFETCICEVLQGLNGCTNIADDVLVYGTTYDEFKNNVLAFLDCCVQEDMPLNPDKVKIDCCEVPFFGNILSKDGLSPDTRKVELIQQWPTPTNHKELQSFLGMVNYLSRLLVFFQTYMRHYSHCSRRVQSLYGHQYTSMPLIKLSYMSPMT